MVSRYFHFDSRLTGNIHLAAAKGNSPCGFSALGASGDHRSVPPSPAENAKTDSCDTFSFPGLPFIAALCSGVRTRLPRWRGKRDDSRQHASKELPRQMALGQQPVVPRVLTVRADTDSTYPFTVKDHESLYRFMWM